MKGNLFIFNEVAKSIIIDIYNTTKSNILNIYIHIYMSLLIRTYIYVAIALLRILETKKLLCYLILRINTKYCSNKSVKALITYFFKIANAIVHICWLN